MSVFSHPASSAPAHAAAYVAAILGWVFTPIDGEVWDFTAEQFEERVPYEDSPATREEALADTSLTQLFRLAEAFDAKWGEG
jgi:hypothetical protein